MSWEKVPQEAPGRIASKPDVAVSLSTGARGTTRLWLTLSPAALEALNWSPTTKLGLLIGRDERTHGWICVEPDEQGRGLRKLPTSSFVAVAFVPPEELVGQNGDRAAPEHKVLTRDRALLVQLPWPAAEGPVLAEAA
ncbi:hypothetical protein ACI2KH_06155 [Roseomonas mucosa]|uniref:hypothetical protein n=1 Tax=Roseomonas mucosa TaxID=207340 RepID=UPI00384EF8FD